MWRFAAVPPAIRGCASRPDRAELERILGGDRELIGMLFEDSIEDVLDRYVDDQRLKDALCGQGLIGTFAGPRDPGTASIHLMHSQGDLNGLGAVWGYVEGGMGRISYALAQAAQEAGAVLATGVQVAEIIPGRGRPNGRRGIHPRADRDRERRPKAHAGDADGNLPSGSRERLEAWDVSSPVVKLNATLGRPPSFEAAVDGFESLPGDGRDRAGAGSHPGGRRGRAAGKPAFGFAELSSRPRTTPRSRPRASM